MQKNFLVLTHKLIQLISTFITKPHFHLNKIIRPRVIFFNGYRSNLRKEKRPNVPKSVGINFSSFFGCCLFNKLGQCLIGTFKIRRGLWLK